MDTKIAEAIDSLENSGNSASLAVAEHLCTVASNGEEESTREYLRNEALAIIGAADSFLIATGPKTECFRMELAGYPIVLSQTKRGGFSVRYGEQLDSHLSYDAACEKLGEAIMHALACESRIETEDPRL